VQAKVILRLFISGLIAFISYSAWAYFANSLVTDNQQVLIKAALVQGLYSGGVTLFFTFLLEIFYSKFGRSTYCLPLVLPRINSHSKQNPCATHETFTSSIKLSERKCRGKCMPGAMLSPIPALIVQSIMVISINIAFATPNLWLTVAPSILFSAIYGYSYSLSIAKKESANKAIEKDKNTSVS
jgi:hypothetical protein